MVGVGALNSREAITGAAAGVGDLKGAAAGAVKLREAITGAGAGADGLNGETAIGGVPDEAVLSGASGAEATGVGGASSLTLTELTEAVLSMRAGSPLGGI